MSALLSLKQVMERIPFSKTEIYRRIRTKEFPQPVRIGRHRIAFAEREIDAWIAAKSAQRDGGSDDKH